MSRVSTRTFVIAFVISPHASSNPDGLQKVAADTGIGTSVQGHATTDSPLAHYTVHGVHNSMIGTGLARIAGVCITFALGMGLFAVVRRSRRHRSSHSAMAP
jgi:cobalt/nickel transport system permease protein